MVIALTVGCNATLTRSSEVPDWYREEWSVGQEKVAGLVGDDAYTIHPEHFKTEEMPGVFDCGGVQANGCFSTAPVRVRYNVETPTVVRHEAGHAILWKLGQDCWRDYEHTPYPYGCKEEQ